MIYKKSIFQRLVPLLTFIFLVSIFSFTIWQHINSEYETLQLQTQITGEQTKIHFESWIRERIQIVEQLSYDFSKGDDIDSTLFVARTSELRNWFPGLQALNWIDADFNIAIVNPYKGNETALNKNLLKHPYLSVRETIKKALTTKKMVRTEIVELFQGGEGFVVYCPVLNANNKLKGYINGVIKIDQLVKNSLSSTLLDGRFYITFTENNIPFYSNTDYYHKNSSEFQKTFDIDVLGTNWQMKMIPQENYINATTHNNMVIFVIFLIIVSGGLSIFINQTIHRHFALKNSEEKFRTVVEQAGDAFYIINDDRVIMQVNQQACEDLGYTREELIGKHVYDLDGAHNKKSLDRIKKQIDSRKMEQLDSYHRHKDGSLIPVHIRFGLFLANGKPYHLCLARNMTKPRRLQELESRAQRLETAGQVAGQVAHDFNNLLAPLMAYPEFIRELLDDSHPAHEYIDDIEHSAKQIAEINQQLLTLGRRGHYNQEIFNLNTLTNQVVRQMRNEFKDVTIDTEFDEQLLNIKGGVSQISRIMINLLHNAIDATEEKGTITISTKNYYVDETSKDDFQVPAGEYVRMTIADDGHGIPNDLLQNIFLPFMTTKKVDKKRGSGLGLSVVEAVMKDHNGFIDVTSEENIGTVFYLYFPITRKEIIKKENDDVHGGDETILVVDDDPGIRNVIEKILVQFGYEVTVVDCGESALEFMKEQKFDLVILDMIIQNGIDGTETYQQILKINPNQKGIIVSGYAETERVQEALDLGVTMFIKKPFESRLLAASVRNTLDSTQKIEKEFV